MMDHGHVEPSRTQSPARHPSCFCPSVTPLMRSCIALPQTFIKTLQTPQRLIESKVPSFAHRGSSSSVEARIFRYAGVSRWKGGRVWGVDRRNSRVGARKRRWIDNVPPLSQKHNLECTSADGAGSQTQGRAHHAPTCLQCPSCAAGGDSVSYTDLVLIVSFWCVSPIGVKCIVRSAMCLVVRAARFSTRLTSAAVCRA
jgi:hypothetical protein